MKEKSNCEGILQKRLRRLQHQEERGRKMREKMGAKLLGLMLILVVTVTNVFCGKTLYAEAASSITVRYSGSTHTFNAKNQTKAKVNGKVVKTVMPGVIVDGVNLVSPTVFKTKALGITYKYNAKSKVVTLKKNGTIIKITMGSNNAKVNGKKVSMGAKALRMYYVAKKKNYNMLPARFVIETFGMSYTWKQASGTCLIKTKSTVTPTTTPTVKPTVKPTATPIVTQKPVETPSDSAVSSGPATFAPSSTVSGSSTSNAEVEMKAMWISYLEYGSGAKTEAQFTKKMNTMFDNCVSYGMNTVIVQVRPFSDAMYESAYFPWSKYVSGTLGTDPGYDPLKIMVELAHEKGLKIQAWVNPYRVTLGSTNVSALPAGHPAKKWRNSSSETTQRRVLSYGGNLYYNPSSAAVRTLIVDGVKEIVQNYDVDGIHFDDYFYPNLGTDYKTNFDAKEYDTYVENCESDGTTPKTIVQWRRTNVNTLVKKVYAAVKEIDPNVEFGISPAGNINNLLSSSAYYVNVKTWMANSGYVDYICPQIYWSFQNSTCPYAATVDKWAALKTSDSVKLYIGIAVYRAGSDVEKEWANSDDVLKRQIEYGRGVSNVSGFAFYRYDSFQSSACQAELANLLPLLK